MQENGPTTLEDPARSGPLPVGLRLTVLWHRDAERVGQRAWVPWTGEQETLEISRQEPVFSDGRPLEDGRLSRSPVVLAAAGGGIDCRPGRDGLKFDVNGTEGSRDGLAISPLAVARGFRLGLGKGAEIHLQLGPRPRVWRAERLIGTSEALEQVLVQVDQAAATSEPVLLRGEPGTGSRLVAEAIHAGGARSREPFVIATDDPATWDAGRGTLLFPGVEAWSADAQERLLAYAGPCRLIAATTEDLEDACARGAFSTPLYERLSTRIITLPALRDRPGDIAFQAVSLMKRELDRRGRRWPQRGSDAPAWLGREVMDALLDWTWPGNTRELKSVIARLVEEHADHAVCAPPRFRSLTPVSRAPTLGAEAGELDIRAALAQCDYRLTATAELLGIGRNTLKRRMEAENIRRPTDIPPAEIRAVLQRSGSVANAARELGVSEHGLKIRISELR